MTKAKITHRCDSRISPDLSWSDEADRVPCQAVRRSDGTVENSMQCGEPCSWIMGKSGHGIPPYEAKDGFRFNPFEPDQPIQWESE